VESILSYLDGFNLSDLIDISVVGYIIYRFLIIIQGTRSVQMLLGLGSMAILFAISITFKLYSLNWVLNHFFEYFFIIIIIFFQDQIRNALVALGEARFFQTSRVSVIDSEIEEVVSASFLLSKEKTGALIVFEKNHGLLNYSSTGTRLNCQLHADLLYSLFQVRSPMHDGAIIIAHGKIQSVGCFLPLSKNTEVDRHMGSRHRAALGLSEVSDAIIVVVSEETGKVNLFHSGNSYMIDSENTLRKFLKKFLLSKDETIPVERYSPTSGVS